MLSGMILTKKEFKQGFVKQLLVELSADESVGEL